MNDMTRVVNLINTAEGLLDQRDKGQAIQKQYSDALHDLRKEMVGVCFITTGE